jgi:hypothetical protein
MEYAGHTLLTSLKILDANPNEPRLRLASNDLLRDPLRTIKPHNSIHGIHKYLSKT